MLCGRHDRHAEKIDKALLSWTYILVDGVRQVTPINNNLSGSDKHYEEKYNWIVGVDIGGWVTF